jgi:hypothetical protein
MLTFLKLLILTAALHPIHLSVTEIYTEEASHELAFSVTFFMDDFGVAAEYEKYATDINAGKMTVDDLILNHLEEHLVIKADGRALEYEIVSKETNFPSVTCQMRFQKAPKDLSSLEVKNTLLLDMFDDQKNMVNIRIPGRREGTMILNRKKKQSKVSF